MTVYRVLIVDDSRFMRQVLSDVVNADDAFTVAAVASNGEEAVQLALELKPDIITMDLEMPRMNGLEALQQIMTVCPTPIIMMSAVTDNGTRDTIKALQYGAFDFVRKPDKSLRLDIGEVSKYLMEKLRTAAASMGDGPFRMMPAVDIDGQTAAPEPDPPLPKDAQRQKEQPQAPPGLAEPESEPKAPKTREGPQAQTGFGLSPKRIESGSGPGETPPKPLRNKHDKTDSASKPAKETPLLKRFPEPSPDAEGVKPSAAVWKPEPAAQKAPAATGKVLPFQPPAAKGKIRHSPQFTQIVAMGTSTGGPRALHEVLTRLPEDFEAPVLVVQHMPPKFTQSLAQRLDSFCPLRVCEAGQGDVVETGTVYIAPGGKQMKLDKEPSGKYRIKLTDEGPRNGHMPSVDVLFESLIGHRSLKRHVVLMTGMGSDGAAGMQMLQQDGAETRIAESQETCVVYGMPRAAVKLGAVSHVLPLQQIASVLVREVRARSK